MWTCSKCDRVFERVGQRHSCTKVPLETHFKNKERARELFELLVERIKQEIGEVRLVLLPCCVHLFGKYDFLAALPKKDRLEIRFALNRKLDSPRLKIAVPLSTISYKNCIDVANVGEIDKELLGWVKESYFLKG